MAEVQGEERPIQPPRRKSRWAFGLRKRVLRELRFGRELAREASIAGFVPYTTHVDPHTVRTKEGYWLQVIRIEGLPFETLSDEELEYRKDVHNALLRSLASSRFAVYHHLVRRRAHMELRGEFPDPFSSEVDERWRAARSARDSFVNEHYLTVVRRDLGGSAGRFEGWVRAFGSLGPDEREARAAREALERKALDEAVQSVLRVLAPYGARRLGLRALTPKGSEFGGSEFGETRGDAGPEERASTGTKRCRTEGVWCSEVLEFLGYLLSHEARAVQLPKGPIDCTLGTKRITFGRDAFEIRGPADSDRTLGAMLSIKEYAPETAAGMLDGLLRLPHAFVLTESFAFVDRQRALGALSLQRRQLRNAEDEAVSLEVELEDASDRLASGQLAFGEHHLTLCVQGRNLDELDQAVSAASAELTALGILVVREDLNLEPAFWAQLPGNFALIARRALISSANFAGLSSFHNFPAGALAGHHWGSALTVLETSARTPYALSLHEGDLGNFTVIGPSGSGKTVLLGFLMAQAQRFSPRSVFFDKDRGAEIFVRALGGRYARLEPGQSTGMNPLQLPDTPANRAFLCEWLALLVRQGDARSGGDASVLAAHERRVIAEAVDANFAAPPELRQLAHLEALFRGQERGGETSLGSRLRPWFGDGDRAWLFDHPCDALELEHRTLGFDLTYLLGDPIGCVPTLAYLFHRIDTRLDGHPTLLFLDEGWKALDDPLFENRLRDWLKTVRKKNGLVGFGTQSASDALDSRIADTLREQCPTQIFLPNRKATPEAYCGGFGLSSRELELVRTLPDTSRAFLLKQGSGSVVARLDLAGLEDLIAVLSGREQSVALLDRLRRELGDAPAQWLDAFRQCTAESATGAITGPCSRERSAGHGGRDHAKEER